MAEKEANKQGTGKDAAAAKAKAAGMAKAAKSKGGGGLKVDDGDYKPSGERVEPRLQDRFKKHVRKSVGEKFGITNPMLQPRLEKIVVNVNMGRHLEGAKLPVNVKTTVLDTIIRVTGQKPVVLKAKKSVSNFKVREGLETAAMVTLRRDRMWHFLDRLINLAAPRIKDFRGLSDKAFDPQGNYSFGLTEQGVFPEINMAEATFTHGMHINFVFSNSTPELSRHVLGELGMPFVKPEDKPSRKK